MWQIYISEEGRKHMMKIHNSYESLAALGFIPDQIERLQRLRAIHDEKEQEEQRRLEFVRWLVDTGRLTDGIALPHDIYHPENEKVEYQTTGS